MEDWQKEFWQKVDTAGEQIGEFLEEVAQEVLAVGDVVELISAEMTLQLSDTTTTIEQSITAGLMPLIDALLGLNAADNPFDEAQPAWPHHPICVGCRHYHGQIYGETLLVCGMHPYGVETETCSDREAAPDRPFQDSAADGFDHPNEDEDWYN